MVTLVAVALLATAVARITGGVRPRALTCFGATAALLCAGYGLLDVLAPREALKFPLTFQSLSGPMSVLEARVPHPYARPELLVAFALVLCVPTLLRRPRGHARRPPFRAWLRGGAGMMLLALASAPYAATLVGALGNPPRGYDALWYHLPMAVGFARNHHLEPPGRDLVFYFPANVELLARAAYDALGARALALVQWPFAFGAALATSALARAIGFRRHARLATALVLGAPMVIFQSQLAYSDVVGLFAVALAAALLVGAVRARTLALALRRGGLAGLLLGLLLGAKYAALPLLAALALPLLLWSLAPDGRIERRHAGRAALLCAVIVVGALIPSWFWYLRNLRLTGNPLFPIAIPSLHLRGLFPSHAFNPGKELEFAAAPWQWLLYPWLERTSHESGLGAGFATLVPLGVGALIWPLAGRLRRGRLPAFGLPLVWGALYLAMWWIATPHEPRHLLPLVSLFGAPALGLLERAASRPALLAAVAAGVGFSSIMALRTLLFSPTPELSARPRTLAALYDLPTALTDQVPAGSLVANQAGRPYNFPLLGPRLTWRLFDYSPAWPTEADLRYHGVDFLLYRGPKEELPIAPPGPLRYLEPARNLAWWESRPGDVTALYQVR